MDTKSYIAGKLVPDMLRQKIINIEGSEDLEFINIDSVDVKELTEAFALTKPYSVDVQLSRFSERDVKHKFNLVVKVSRYNVKYRWKNSRSSSSKKSRIKQRWRPIGCCLISWKGKYFYNSKSATRRKISIILIELIPFFVLDLRSLQNVLKKFTSLAISTFYSRMRRRHTKTSYQLWAGEMIFPSEFLFNNFSVTTKLDPKKINKFELFPDFITLKFKKIDALWFWTISPTTDGRCRRQRSTWT